ncbi:hypothetical protein AAFP35_15165 [Gordonia sp. CPCC 206044]|uniref:hypothetical protein n=1 Tax=Gordonia sp. CPCC 206044 TaxID=3140793 RepID=UPI003AF3DB22
MQTRFGYAPMTGQTGFDGVLIEHWNHRSHTSTIGESACARARVPMCWTARGADVMAI